MIISEPSKRIGYISQYAMGKLHDYRFLKHLFPPQKNYFENFHLRVDLGFLGIVKDYLCQSVSIPHKKPRKAELTTAQVAENKQLAAERIAVKHSIGGLKRFRILSDRLRIHDLSLYNHILGVCAALWNFFLMPCKS